MPENVEKRIWTIIGGKNMVCIKTNKVKQPMQISTNDDEDGIDNGHAIRIYWHNRFRLLCDGSEDMKSMRIICATNSNVLGNEYYYLV